MTDTTVTPTPCTVDLPDPEIVYVTTFMPGYVWILVTILVLAFILATAIVRYKAHGERTIRARSDNEHRVSLAKHRKVCMTCGSDQLLEATTND